MLSVAGLFRILRRKMLRHHIGLMRLVPVGRQSLFKQILSSREHVLWSFNDRSFHHALGKVRAKITPAVLLVWRQRLMIKRKKI